MKRQAFQPGEIRDNNDNIIREGAYGKKTALATSDNMGILDYIINNFDALHDAMNGGRVYVKSAADLPKAGDVAAVYIAEDTGKWYYWDPGTSKYVATDNARTVANDAISARDTAKSWAESSSSPDGEIDADSSTGKTQSSKSWALYSKDRATASASSASASASSASAAKSSQTAAATSETNAKSSEDAAVVSAEAAAASQDAAKTSETNAKSSEDAAVVSAKAAAASQIAAKTSEANAQDYMERSEAILATLITKDGQLVVGSATQPTDGSHWIEPISDRSWTLAASKIVASKDRPDDAYAVWNEMLE